MLQCTDKCLGFLLRLQGTRIMKIWLIKHKGADWWGNYRNDYEITLEDGTKIYSQLCFYRKKDALAYLKTRSYPEYLEVVGKS